MRRVAAAPRPVGGVVDDNGVAYTEHDGRPDSSAADFAALEARFSADEDRRATERDRLRAGLPWAERSMRAVEVFAGTGTTARAC